MSDEKFMRLAIEKAREGIHSGQTPFGACIVKNGEVISCVHNIVLNSTDITAHAEINAIRQACRRLNTIDLSGCSIYSTCEPCPMCFSACHWARISKVVFGASIEDAHDSGFNELHIPNKTLKELGESKIEIIADFLRDECLSVFHEWEELPNKKVY